MESKTQPTLEDAIRSWKKEKNLHRGPKYCLFCKRECHINELRIVDQFCNTLTGPLFDWFNEFMNDFPRSEEYQYFHIGWDGSQTIYFLNYCPECFFIRLRTERDACISEELFEKKIMYRGFSNNFREIHWGDTQPQTVFAFYEAFLMTNFPTLWFEIYDKHHTDTSRYKPKEFTSK